ncbi:MAG: 50S ribosome-binding GTPase [Ignavibacteria bacterium]|nr:50S ribosome-binding GTPase [Ignavibacteria bacterium]
MKDQLFATLDTTVRSLELPNGRQSVISDTVGFIRKLPTHLIASFRSTLAEAADADVLVHVVDCSHAAFREQIAVVHQTLEDLEIGEKSTLLVLNKSDAIAEDERNQLEIEYPNSILISAEKGLNLDVLLLTMQQAAERGSTTVSILIPYSEMNLLKTIYESGEIHSRIDGDDGSTIEITIPHDKKERFMRLCGVYVQK